MLNFWGVYYRCSVSEVAIGSCVLFVPKMNLEDMFQRFCLILCGSAEVRALNTMCTIYSLGIGVSQDYRFQYDGSMFYVALSWGITARDPKPAEGWGVPLHSMRPTFFITFQRFVPGGPLPVISEVITPYKYVASVIQLFSAIYRGPISPYL